MKKNELVSTTNAEGSTTLNVRFGIATHYFNILKMHLFRSTSIFSDGVIIISKKGYMDKRVLIDRQKYRQEILNEQTIILKIIMDK